MCKQTLCNKGSELSTWNVHFSSSFWENLGPEGAGEEMPIRKQFTWCGKQWIIPSVYVCQEGLVIDFCVRIPSESIRAFMDKWELSEENDGSDFTKEQQLLIDYENPLTVDINPQIRLKDSVVSGLHDCCICWNPCCPGLKQTDSEKVIAHYGLDPASGWIIWRSSFPLALESIRIPAAFSVTMKQGDQSIPGPQFCTSDPGAQIAFTHPVTGLLHTLTIQSCGQHEIPQELLRSKTLKLPAHCLEIEYTLSPELYDDAIKIIDLGDSIFPCNGVIFYNRKPSKFHSACSVLHSEPAANVKWQIVFLEKTCEDLTVRIDII